MKHLVSLMIVICMMFSGIFGVLASAESVVPDYTSNTGQFFLDQLEKSTEKALTAHNNNIPISDFYTHQPPKSEASLSNWSGSGDMVKDSYAYYTNSQLLSVGDYFDMFANRFGVTLPDDYYYIIWVVDMGYYQVNCHIFYNVDMSAPYTFTYDPSTTNNYGRVNFNVNFGTSTFNHLGGQIVHNASSNTFGGIKYNYLASVSNGGNYTNQTGGYSNSYVFSSVPYYETNMQPTDLSIHWSSDFAQDENTLTTTINATSSLVGPLDLRGYKVAAGIVYHDYDNDVHGVPSSDYIFYKDASGGTVVQSSIINTFEMNIKDLETWRKRKRADLYNYFYVFAVVYDPDGKEVHYNQKIINFSDVDDGIFADTLPTPDWEDYKPEVIELPTIVPTSFDYLSHDTYQTINNYTGTDFDFSSFFGWFENNFVAMANNIGAFFGNAQAFMNAFADFEVNGVVNAILEIGSIIDDLNLNLNADFNNFGDFITDVNNTLDGNIKILIDGFNNEIQSSFDSLKSLIDTINLNFESCFDSVERYFDDLNTTIDTNIETIIENAGDEISIQLVPDTENIRYILVNYTGWYYQIYNIFNDYSVTPSPITISIPYLSDSVVLEVPSSFSDFRDVLTGILYAATSFTCFRIGFQIFGIELPDDD